MESRTSRSVYHQEIEGARIDDKIKTPNSLEAGGDVSAKWPSRRISRRKVVNKGRTLKEKRCAHSNELCVSHIGDR